MPPASYLLSIFVQVSCLFVYMSTVVNVYAMSGSFEMFRRTTCHAIAEISRRARITNVFPV